MRSGYDSTEPDHPHEHSIVPFQDPSAALWVPRPETECFMVRGTVGDWWARHEAQKGRKSLFGR